MFLIRAINKSQWDRHWWARAVTPRGCVQRPPRKPQRSLLPFCTFTLQKRGTGVRPGECLGQETIPSELREGFQISPPSRHSSGLKEAPGQKWPKTGTDCLDVARRRHSLPRPTLFWPRLPSWFWLEGWRIINRQRRGTTSGWAPSLLAVSSSHFVALIWASWSL